MSKRLSRRTILRGLGTALALPMLESMAPTLRAADDKSKPPTRMAVLFIPNGAHMPAWTPTAEGTNFELPHILEPLAPYKQDLLVLSGLTQDGARPHGDGGGDHARSAAAFLTGSHPRKTHGADLKAGVSFDQVAAQKLGNQTRFASLELGCERGQQAGNCDTGYSCAYSSNIAWRTESTPVAKEINPRLVFERLFASDDKTGNAESRGKRALYQKSVLDFVLDDAKRLRTKLGGTDQRKLDEYLTSVRELENRLQRPDKSSSQEPTDIGRPEGIPKDYQQHVRLMCDMMVLAFQADLTRVVTFMLANEGSNRAYPSIGVHESHHDLSHHGNSAEKQAKVLKINRFHMEQFAYLLDKLKNISEGEGSLLDHSMLLYGGGISDGDQHNHDDLPIVLVGQGSGKLRGGRHVRYAKNTPLNNLFLSMLDRMEVPVESLGDSNGRLEQLG
jgi:hypothetical protein